MASDLGDLSKRTSLAPHSNDSARSSPATPVRSTGSDDKLDAAVAAMIEFRGIPSVRSRASNSGNPPRRITGEILAGARMPLPDLPLATLDTVGILNAIPVSTITPSMKLKSLILFSVGSLAACSPKKPAESSSEVGGTQVERIAKVSKIVTRNSPLPSALTDAHFVEEQTGDDQLGPADFKSFSVMAVAPAELPAWKAALAPLEAHNTPPVYVAPKNACPWWLSTADFAGLEFRSSKSLSGRVNGWAGIAPDGRIFVYSFTM